MQKIFTARAYATVANQPGFDLGGFCVKVVETIGENPKWETLYDEVEISLNEKAGQINVENIIEEENVDKISDDPLQNTAALPILKTLGYLKDNGIKFNYGLHIKVKKGLSVKGTGLGSSGASASSGMKAFEKILNYLKIDLIMGDGLRATILRESDFMVPDNSIPSYFGGLILITDNNGKIEIEKILKNKNFGVFVLTTPRGFGIKTADARKVLQGLKAPEENKQYYCEMIEAIKNGDSEKYGNLMEKVHDWFVSRRSRLYPGNGKVYDEVYRLSKDAGSLGTTISGSGPTIFAIAENLEKARIIAQNMNYGFANFGFNAVSRIVDVDEQGAL